MKLQIAIAALVLLFQNTLSLKISQRSHKDDGDQSTPNSIISNQACNDIQDFEQWWACVLEDYCSDQANAEDCATLEQHKHQLKSQHKLALHKTSDHKTTGDNAVCEDAQNFQDFFACLDQYCSDQANADDCVGWGDQGTPQTSGDDQEQSESQESSEE